MQTRLLLVLLFSLGLSACDQHHAQPDIASSDPVAASSVADDSAHDDEDQGSKLVDVAGQATLPVETPPNHKKSTSLSPEALQYTGRYHVHIPCSDPVARCKGSEAGALQISMGDKTLKYLSQMRGQSIVLRKKLVSVFLVEETFILKLLTLNV